MADYSKMTTEDFENTLRKLVNSMPNGILLLIPGVYEIVAEYYNNEVLELWADANPEKAYPEDYENED